MKGPVRGLNIASQASMAKTRGPDDAYTLEDLETSPAAPLLGEDEESAFHHTHPNGIQGDASLLKLPIKAKGWQHHLFPKPYRKALAIAALSLVLLGVCFPLGMRQRGEWEIRDGLFYVDEQPEVHPIRLLISRAQARSMEMERLREEVSTYDRAVENYQQTFGLNPPEGFDTW